MKRVELFFLLLVSNVLFAQITVTTGNLLRYNFTKPQINLSDTLWHWTNISTGNSGLSQSCVEYFEVGSTKYLVTFSFESTPWIERRMNYLCNLSTRTNREIISMLNWIDPLIPYLYTKPIIEKVNGGAWVFYGWQRNAFFVRNDSVYEGNVNNNYKIVHNAGKSNNSNFLVVENLTKKKYEFYVADLTKSPRIILNNKIEIANAAPPIEFHYLKDSLYLFKTDGSNELYLTSLSNNKINFLKRLKPETSTTTYPDLSRWFFNENEIFYINKSLLYKETVDLELQACKNKVILLNLENTKYAIDQENNYITYIKNDSLFVYTVNKQKHDRTISYTLKNNHHLSFISAPYIYFHNEQRTTSVGNQDNIPQSYSLSQNFPNPFNPETTISYKVQAASQVSLKVFDVLGREVATLVNEYKQPGTYNEKFNVKTRHGASLQSGIYFYRLQAGDPSAGSGRGFVQTKKMALIK